MAAVSIREDISTSTMYLTVAVERALDKNDVNSVFSKAIAEMAKELAEQYVKEHKAEILESFSPVAISNLALADSAKLVRQQFIDPKPVAGETPDA